MATVRTFSAWAKHPEEEALADEKVQLEKILLWPLAFWPYCLPVSAETRRYPVVKGYA
jgi:hypothetical protein